jgi:hypothetical protein
MLGCTYQFVSFSSILVQVVERVRRKAAIYGQDITLEERGTPSDRHADASSSGRCALALEGIIPCAPCVMAAPLAQMLCS